MTHGLWVVLPALILLVAVAVFVEFVRAMVAVPLLEEEPPLEGPSPLVSIVIAARNEGPHIGDALRSVLAQEYASYEVILVDDRSTDDTGVIADEVARTSNRLRVLHLTELPPGWLGKNHALWCGAEAASGEYILFTDADVVFEPSALARAMHFVVTRHVDHLTAGPDIIVPTIPLAIAMNYFGIWFVLYMRPRKASDSGSRHHIGIGAFNLVRREAYVAAGTLARIALRPDDDIKLGKLLKQSGARQQAVAGRNVLRVTWYHTLREMIRGVRKNSFAVIDYRLSALVVLTLSALLVNVWPFVAVWLTSGVTRILYSASAVVLMALYATAATLMRNRPWLAPTYPIAALISLYMLLAAVVQTLVQRGISWRGTFYSLDDLKRNRV